MKQEPAWWATARNMRLNGEKIITISETFGVTESAVRNAINPEPRRRTTAAWMKANRPHLRQYYNAWRLSRLSIAMEHALQSLPLIIKLKQRPCGRRSIVSSTVPGIDPRPLRALERRGLAEVRIERQGRVVTEQWERCR